MSPVSSTTEPAVPLTLTTAPAAWLNDITPVVELYAISPVALIADLTLVSV